MAIKFGNVESSSHKVKRFGPHRMAQKGPGKKMTNARMRGRKGIRK